MIAIVYECNECGIRYPLIPYYPYAAPHGPNRDCHGTLGWTRIREVISP